MLEYETFHWTSLHPWAYLALLKSGTKKGKIQKKREEMTKRAKYEQTLHWPQPPGTQNRYARVNRGPPLTLYLRPDGEEVESNISSLIMVSDMRLSRRGPAALPPIPCIIITEWRCGDAEMRGNIATLMSGVHWSQLVHCPPCPAATITRAHHTY